MEEKREGSRSLSQQEEDALQSIARSDLGGLFKARMDEGFTLLYANDSYYAIHGYTRGQLEQELLGGGEPLILMELHLAKVIDKADDAEYQRKRKHDEGAEIPGLEILPARGHHRHGDTQNKHQAAHHRGSLLAVVPGGPYLTDALTHMQRPQGRNQEPASDCRNDKGDHTCNNALHIQNPPISIMGSPFSGRSSAFPAEAPYFSSSIKAFRMFSICIPWLPLNSSTSPGFARLFSTFKSSCWLSKFMAFR